MRPKSLTLVVLVSLFALLTPSAPVAAVVQWELNDESVSLGMNGVSPHVERTESGDRVWRSDMVPAGTAVSLCNDAGMCTSETLTAPGGPVSDFAVAVTPSGTRAYFKRLEMATQTQAVYSAPCENATCTTIGQATLASAEMRVSRETRAWGVPDPVRLPNGNIRIYIVESPNLATSCPEKVASYISSDGITFTKEPGWRLEGGYVDTEVLRARDGEWLMIMANGPGCGPRQRLFVSTSNDGLVWATPQALTGTDMSRLDPTGYEVTPNVFRIYYAAGGAGGVYQIRRAVMRIKQGGGDVSITGKPSVTKSKKKSTITCVKGKTVRKVTTKTCPKGFTKR